MNPPPYERLVVKQRVQISKTRNYDKAPKQIQFTIPKEQHREEREEESVRRNRRGRKHDPRRLVR